MIMLFFVAPADALGGFNLLRRYAEAVAVSEEQDTLAFALSTLGGLNPLAPAGARVHALEESQRTTLDVGSDSDVP